MQSLLIFIINVLCVCNTLIYLKERPCHFTIIINFYDRILKGIVMDTLQRSFAGNYVRKTHVSDYELIYEYDRN